MGRFEGVIGSAMAEKAGVSLVPAALRGPPDLFFQVWQDIPAAGKDTSHPWAF
jgi:hypothetical protein